MSRKAFDLHPLSGALGAEVSGLDLRESVPATVAEDLRQAFHDHLVLVFRDQELTVREQAKFATTFAPLEPHPFVESLPGEPGMIEIVKEPDEAQQWGGLGVHADLTFLEAPPRGALLYAREVPAVGGDTLFVNMTAVYESLSEGLRACLKPLKALHVSLTPKTYSAEFKGMKGRAASRASEQCQRFVHPVIIRHPDTGRASLYVNPLLTKSFEGMTEAESRPLLDTLFSRAQQPEFSFRLRWRPGSLVAWDNRVCLHYALNDDFAAQRGEKGFRRVMHRATFAGDRPQAAFPL